MYATGRGSRQVAMSHSWMSHGIRMKESCHTYELVMPYIQRWKWKHMNGSFYMHEWVMSRKWFSHVTRLQLVEADGDDLYGILPLHMEKNLQEIFGWVRVRQGPLKFRGCRVWITDYGILVEDYLCKWVLSNSCTRHVTHEWVMSLIRVGRVMRVKLPEQADGVRDVSCHTRMNESSHTFEWVMSHTRNW